MSQVQTFRFRIGDLEVEVMGSDMYRSLAESLARSAVEALRWSERPVLCPGGFRIEYGNWCGAQYVVCHDAFSVVKSGNKVIVKEIGYYREVMDSV